MAPNLETNVCNEVKGTILITGANGSLGYWFVWTLLRNYPSCFAILAVRDDGAQDPNTSRLRKMIAGFKDAKVSIEKVDLASLSSVRYFADSVSARISTGALPPISALVCNAFNWSLVGQQKSLDGYDLSFQVTHLSHFLLVLKLLGSVDKKSGRVVFLGSEAHDENNVNGFNKLGAVIPENLEQLLRPPADEPGEGQPRGFQRYGNAKLATVMFMHMLNRKLLQDPSLQHITALAMDPAGMPSSRAFNNVPLGFKAAMFIIGHSIAPVARYFTPLLNTPANAGRELVALSVGPEGEGVRGYFLRLQLKESSVQSQDEEKQKEVWAACEKWVVLDPSETVLSLSGGA